MAFVVFQNDSAVDWQEIIAHCEAELAAFKVPRFWKDVIELPKNAMNRVVKARLTEKGYLPRLGETFDREKKG